jgi:hypothetical protein
MQAYRIFQSRLTDYGNLAPFPEFEPAVSHLLEALARYAADPALKENHDLQRYIHMSKIRLMSVMVGFSVDKGHPQSAPFPQAYPYIPTIEAVRDALTTLDVLARKKYDNLPDLYHTDRYSHHYTHIYNSDFIWFPFASELTLDDFIELRGVPISFLGVSAEPVHADAYFNSPLEFFIHDVNHIRRLEGYNDQLIERLGMEPEEVYQIMSDQAAKFVPHIKIIPDMDLEEREVRQILSVLLFEYLHELAFTPDPETFKAAVLQEPGALSPFEVITDSATEVIDSDARRLDNFNIASGYSMSRFYKSNHGQAPTIRFFYDRFPNFITSAYNKCTSDFFDTAEKRADFLPPMERRTEDLFVRAVVRMLKLYDQEELLGEEAIRGLLQSKVATITYPTQAVPSLSSRYTMFGRPEPTSTGAASAAVDTPAEQSGDVPDVSNKSA